MLPFALSMMLMVFQQWTGVNTVIFYTVTIFTAARVSVDEHLASNLVGLVQLLATASRKLIVWKYLHLLNAVSASKFKLYLFPILSIFDRESISHGPTSLKILVQCLVKSFTFSTHSSF